MKSMLCVLVVVFVATFVAGATLAQEDLIIYPAEGQTPEQMEKDKFECYSWAKQQTGFDPMQQQPTQEPPPRQGPQGERITGATRGAAIGAVTGAIKGDDVGKSAGAGAAGGAMIGGMRSRDQRRKELQEYERQSQQQAAAYEQDRQMYNRAYAVCLEAKG